MTTPFGTVAAREAAKAVHDRAGGEAIEIGIVLGSGLGALAGRIEDRVEIPYAELPGFPVSTVLGHAGALITGTLRGKRVAAFSGRFHMYEGHAPSLAWRRQTLTL